MTCVTSTIFKPTCATLQDVYAGVQHWSSWYITSLRIDRRLRPSQVGSVVAEVAPVDTLTTEVCIGVYDFSHFIIRYPRSL